MRATPQTAPCDGRAEEQAKRLAMAPRVSVAFWTKSSFAALPDGGRLPQIAAVMLQRVAAAAVSSASGTMPAPGFPPGAGRCDALSR